MAFRNPLQSLSVDFANVTGTITADQLGPGVVTGPAIASSAITADKISANAITADKIQAGAIDGTTITGATLQTAAWGQRWVMGSTTLGQFGEVDNTLFGYTGSGNESGPGLVEIGDDTGSGLLELLLRAPATSGHAPTIKIASSYSGGGDRIYLDATGEIDLTAPSVSLNGNATISGTLNSYPVRQIQRGTIPLGNIAAGATTGMVGVGFPSYFSGTPTVVVTTGSSRLTASVAPGGNYANFYYVVNNWTAAAAAGGDLSWIAVY